MRIKILILIKWLVIISYLVSEREKKVKRKLVARKVKKVANAVL